MNEWMNEQMNEWIATYSAYGTSNPGKASFNIVVPSSAINSNWIFLDFSKLAIAFAPYKPVT